MLSVILVYLASGQLSDQATVAAIEAQVEALREQHGQQLQALLESNFADEAEAQVEALGGDFAAEAKAAKTANGVRTPEQICLDGDVPVNEAYGNPGGTKDPAARARFKKFLLNGRDGREGFKGIYSPGSGKWHKNIYLIIGWASAGINENQMPDVKAEFLKWCQENDDTHGDQGWVVLSQGDGHYETSSLVTLFETAMASKKDGGCGVPVYVLQTAGAYNGDDWTLDLANKYNPYYADVLFFGDHKTKNRNQLATYTSAGVTWPNTRLNGKDCWGGYCDPQKQDWSECKDPAETECNLAFVDWVMFESDFFDKGEQQFQPGVAIGKLYDQLGGVFVAGNGAITVDQFEMYKVGTAGRHNDNDLRTLGEVPLYPQVWPSIRFATVNAKPAQQAAAEYGST